MRYARQTILEEVGAEGQEALRQARVLVVGAGGLGSPVGLYLAAAGVGTIGIVDADRVSLSNLQRQILFQTADAGELKGEVAKSRLEGLNPDVSVNIYPVFLDSANAIEIAREYDVVVDASDNFDTKFLLNDLCVHLGKALVYGSILRWQGQVSVFAVKDGPCYRCLYPSPPRGHVPNCAEAGVLGALAGVIGSMQALEVIKLILPKVPGEESLVGRVFNFDAKTFSSKIVKLHKDPECKVCSLAPELVSLPQFNMKGLCKVNDIDFVRDRENFHFIDVREEHEWERGHVPKALLWPLSQMREGKVPTQVAGVTSVVYCQAGVRSKMAIQILQDTGWDLSSVIEMSSGFAGWSGPVEEGM